MVPEVSDVSSIRKLRIKQLSVIACSTALLLSVTLVVIEQAELTIRYAAASILLIGIVLTTFRLSRKEVPSSRLSLFRRAQQYEWAKLGTEWPAYKSVQKNRRLSTRLYIAVSLAITWAGITQLPADEPIRFGFAGGLVSVLMVTALMVLTNAFHYAAVDKAESIEEFKDHQQSADVANLIVYFFFVLAVFGVVEQFDIVIF